MKLHVAVLAMLALSAVALSSGCTSGGLVEDSVSFKINHARAAPPTFGPAEGKVVLRLNVTFENIGTAARTVFPYDFKLEDADKRQFDIFTIGEPSLGVEAFSQEGGEVILRLEPSQIENMEYVFIVPEASVKADSTKMLYKGSPAAALGPVSFRSY